MGLVHLPLTPTIFFCRCGLPYVSTVECIRLLGRNKVSLFTLKAMCVSFIASLSLIQVDPAGRVVRLGIQGAQSRKLSQQRGPSYKPRAAAAPSLFALSTHSALVRHCKVEVEAMAYFSRYMYVFQDSLLLLYRKWHDF